MCGREEKCRLYHGLSLCGPRFDFMAVHLEFVVYKMALEHIFLLRTLAFLCWYHAANVPYSYISAISAI